MIHLKLYFFARFLFVFNSQSKIEKPFFDNLLVSVDLNEFKLEKSELTQPRLVQILGFLRFLFCHLNLLGGVRFLTETAKS
jgi:hypothetical protein